MSINDDLRTIILHSYNTVPYYRDVFDNNNIDPSSIKCTDDLKSLPVLNKEIIKRDQQVFFSSAYDFQNDINNELKIESTTGTTGVPLKVYWSREGLTSSLFHHWRYRSRNFGIDASHRFCSFHYQSKEVNPEIPYKDNKRNVSYNKRYLSDETLKTYYEHMCFCKPDWLYIQPSVAYILASYISENNLKLPPSIRYIELIGEPAFEKYRRFIDEVFSLPTSNMYGCVETNGIAYECRNKKFHLLSNNVIVEVLNKDNIPVGYGEEGDICLTGLCNTAMPFIRYLPGDRVKLFPGEVCGCGNCEPVLELIGGRLSEFVFTGKSGGYEDSSIIYPIQKIPLKFSEGRSTFKFQLIRNTGTSYKVIFKKNTSEKWGEEDLKSKFIDEMNSLDLHNFMWDFEFVDELRFKTLVGALVYY